MTQQLGRGERTHCDAVSGSETRIDGLRILTDTLDDPRRDRVIPLWPEGAGVLASLLSKRCGTRGIVVDLGAGSGILTLLAARRQCRAIGIDNSERAVCFSEANAAANGVTLRVRPHDLRDGEACILLGAVEDASDILAPACADVVVMNPPFNPTMAGIPVALHADAGEDGHDAFRSFSSAAVRLIRNGGAIIGHQMTLRDRRGQMLAIEELRTLLSSAKRGGRLIWFSCLRDPPMSAPAFLMAAYVDLASRNEIDGYINRLGVRDKEFDLICFRLVVEDTSHALRVRQLKSPFLDYGGHRGWTERINIHRDIIRAGVKWGGDA